MQFASKLSTYSVSVGFELLGTGWWNGTDFTTPTPIYYQAVNSTVPVVNTWTYTLGGNLPAAIAAQSGQSIYIVSRSTDNAQNVEYPAGSVPAGVGITANLDFDAPVSSVTYPPNNGFTNNLSSMTGTATEVGPGAQSGVNTVSLAIRRQDGPLLERHPIRGQQRQSHLGAGDILYLDLDLHRAHLDELGVKRELHSLRRRVGQCRQRNHDRHHGCNCPDQWQHVLVR